MSEKGSQKAPQGPPQPPALGAKPAKMNRLHFLTAASRRFGSVIRIHPKLKRYLVTQPDEIKHVLLDNHQNYRQEVPKRPLMGHRSLTMASGDAWRQRRRLLQPLFHSQRLAGLSLHLETSAIETVERWRQPAETGEPVDVAQEMVRFSLEALIRTLFGPDGDNSDLRRSIHQAFDYFDARQRRGGLALPTFIPTPGNRRLKSALAEMRAFIDRLVAERRSDGQDHGDLLSMLIAAEDPQSGQTLDDVDLRDELMMLMVMGHMTTAAALTWTWHLLARHPVVTDRIYQELDAELGDRPPAESDLPRLPYLRQVIQEVLRLYPSTWSFLRRAVGDDVIGGFPIKAGSVVVVCPYVTHRLDALWPNPEIFDPERFSPERSAGRHKCAYLPFGSGPRSCIAASFAQMEMPLVVARVAQAYRMAPVSQDRVEIVSNITIMPKGGLPMKLTPRSADVAFTPAASPAVRGEAVVDGPELGIKTLADLFLNLAERPDAGTLRYRADAGWASQSTSDLAGRVRGLAAGLRQLGIEPGDRVALVAGNSPDWVATDLATVALGAVLVPIDPALPLKETAHLIEASGARAIFADTRDRLDGLSELAGISETARVLVGERATDDGATDLETLIENGTASADEVDALARERKPDDPATLLFPLGGNEEGVLLTHGQLAASVGSLAQTLPVEERHVALCSRSLASPGERALNLLYLIKGATVAYAESPATVDQDLVEIRPHVFSAIPGVLKTVMNRVYDGVRTSALPRQIAFRVSVNVGRRALPQRLSGKTAGLGLTMADRAVFAGIRDQLGGRAEIIVAAGPPVSQGWITFLWAAGIPIYEGYELAEVGSYATMNVPGAIRLETAGRPLPGIEVRIAADGEILLRGPVIAESVSVDSEGWFATGSVGRLDSDGYLRLAGRKADLVTTNSGSEISPMLIERLLATSHFVRNALVYAVPDGPPVALLVPDFEVLDHVAKAHGFVAEPEELIKAPRVRAIFDSEIENFNATMEGEEQVRTWDLIAADLSVGAGDLTPVGTPRHAAHETYRPIAERLIAAQRES